MTAERRFFIGQLLILQTKFHMASSHKELKKLTKRVQDTQKTMVAVSAARPIKAKQSVAKPNVNKTPAPRNGSYKRDPAAPVATSSFNWPK